MKKVFIVTISVCLSLGTMHTLFSAAAAEDVAEQEAAWIEKQRAQQEAIDQANLTPEQKALGEQLIEAAGDGNVERVKELLEQGAPVNFITKGRDTALLMAALSDTYTLPIITLLLNVGAHVDHRGPQGNTPLLMVVRNKRHWEYISALIEAGADVNIPDNDGRTPLIWAAMHGNIYAVDRFLERGAAVNQQDIDGDTALTYAVEKNESKVVRVLILAGADPYLANNAGETALTLSYKSMKGIIEKALHEKRYAEEMEKQLTQESPLPSELRGLVMDYEQEPDVSEQRIREERNKARKKMMARQRVEEPVIERARRASEVEEKEEDEKEEAAAAPVSAQVQAGRRALGERRTSGVEQAVGAREGESFYESALRAAQETQTLRQQEGLQPGHVPLPNPETGFYD